MSNKVVALERQQAQGGKPPQLQYQAQIGGRPPNQWNSSFDQGRQNSHASASSSNQNKAIVPQNNLAQDQDFCPSCNYSYTYCMCQKAESYMALTVQEPAAKQPYKEDHTKEASYIQRQGDCSFMNHQMEEHCNVNQDSVAHNTRSKKRAMEHAAPPSPK